MNIDMYVYLNGKLYKVIRHTEPESNNNYIYNYAIVICTSNQNIMDKKP